MGDRPILFSAPMVRALLDGRKTQTRRIINFPCVENVIEFVHVSTDRRTGVPVFEMKDAAGQHLTRPAGKHCVTPHYSPRFAKGDRLYVRETWSADRLMDGFKPRDMLADSPIWYWADGNPTEGDWIKPKPGIHMPRWASRLTLTVTDVRVQRIQDIRHADAAAEGVSPYAPHRAPQGGSCDGDSSGFDDCARCGFRQLWANINGAKTWYDNVWVVAVTFSVKRGNIDEVEEQGFSRLREKNHHP